jgi:hypothetical protein
MRARQIALVLQDFHLLTLIAETRSFSAYDPRHCRGDSHRFARRCMCQLRLNPRQPFA